MMRKIVSRIILITVLTLLALSTVPVKAYIITVPLFEDGFESGNMNSWTDIIEFDSECSVEVPSNPVKNGFFAMSSTVDAPIKLAIARKDISEVSSLVMRFWLRFDTVTSGQKQYF